MEYYEMQQWPEYDELDDEFYLTPQEKFKEAKRLKQLDKWTWAEIAAKVDLKLEDLLYDLKLEHEAYLRMDD